MDLKEALKQKGRPFEIPDCSRDDLPLFFKQMGYKVGAEIGVGKGKYSEKLCKAGLSLHAIDPWLNYKDYESTLGQKKFDVVYEHAKKLLSSYPNCTIIRKTSMKAVEDFTDNSLDFVYIDGNHQFKYIAEDIFEWTKKVKSGGAISGHDYVYSGSTNPFGLCHVIYVVNAYTQAHGIQNWYLLGRKKTIKGEKRDKWRSWMWIKE